MGEGPANWPGPSDPQGRGNGRKKGCRPGPLRESCGQRGPMLRQPGDTSSPGMRGWDIRSADIGAEKMRRGRSPLIWLPRWAIFGCSYSKRGVDPTNHRAKRALRFAVLGRRMMQGSFNEKGDRWVERILSRRETCRLRGLATYPILVEAVTCCFQGKAPDVSWI